MHGPWCRAGCPGRRGQSLFHGRGRLLACSSADARRGPAPIVGQVWRAGCASEDDDNSFGVAVDVLETLARAHVSGAADALCHYVREGERWVEVLPASAVRRACAVIRGRIGV
jgi:hypothetical protein